MEERQICCCGASGWTRVIGWLQLIGSILGAIVSIFSLAGAGFLASADLSRSSDAEGKPLTQEERDSIKALGSIVTVVAALFLVLFIIHFIMSIVLLKGSYNKNPRLLNAWVIYCIVFLVLYIIIDISKLFSGQIVGTILSMLFTLAIQGFCIWVVWTHKNEVLASQGTGTVFPVKA